MLIKIEAKLSTLLALSQALELVGDSQPGLLTALIQFLTVLLKYFDLLQ